MLSLLMSVAVLSGCGGGGDSGPAVLFLDSVVGAVLSSETPDLWVSSVSGPSSATADSGFFVTVTACNQGVASAGSTVELRLSTDSLITSTDPLVGSAPTGMLHPKQCATLQVRTRPARVADGLWYVGAVVDPDSSVSEGVETNNTRLSTPMAFGSGPDLQVSTVSAPASLSPAARFETAVTVCNPGTASASATVEVYLSKDTDVSTSDTLVGSSPTKTLEPGQCAALTVPSSVNVPEGQWYAAARVGRIHGAPELVESNNTLIASQMTLVGSAPDFTLTEVSGPASLSSTGSLTLTATVCNQGTQGGSTSVQGYLSKDTVITGEDVLVGSASVSHLEPGQCAPVSITGPASVTSGQWYLAASVDSAPGVAELLETNNTRLGHRAAAGDRPDLIVAEVSGPASVASGQPVSATATVCNQGTSSSVASSAALYLSRDVTINTADVLLGGAALPELRAGECAPVKLSGAAHVAEGSWHLGVIADNGSGVPELLENNNTRASSLVGVGDDGDLVITSLAGPASALQGQSFTGRITVCNQGTQAVDATARVALYVSGDAAITASDTLVGDVSLPSLEAGQCATASVSGGAQVPAGTWYLGAITDVDGSVRELIEDNNLHLGSALVVSSPSDVTVTAIRAATSHEQG
jgi:subtilase family serine protease